MKKIESSQNAFFKKLKSLSRSKGIKKEGLCILSGKELIKEHQGQSLHFDPELSPDYLLSKELFQELNPLGSDFPLLLIKCPEIPEIDLNQKAPEGLEVLLPIGDPKNLGAAIRSSYALGASKIILLQESAHPLLPEALKSSSGASLKAPLFQSSISISKLKESHQIWTLDGKGQDLKTFKAPKNLRLLVGEEGGNIPEELKTKSLSISISKEVESLNVNSALSIALFYLSSSS